MAMAVTFMGLVDTFIDLGFLSAIIQAKQINRKQLSSCFWLLLGISIFVSCFAVYAAPYIANAFAEQKVADLVKYLAPILLFAPLNIVCKGILSRDLRLDILAKIELFAGVFKMITSISLALMGMGVFSLLIGYLLERGLLALASAYFAKWYPRFEYEKTAVRQFLSFGSKTTASSLLWYVYTKADIFVIGRVLGADVLGVYSIASQFPQTISRLVPATWNRIAYPLFAKYQQSPELKQILTKSSSLLSLVCLPIFFGLAALAPEVISLTFGPNWGEAVFPLQMLAIVAAIETATGLLPSVLNAIGRPGINMAINLFAVVLFPLAFLGSAHQWGLVGVLWVSIALYSYRYLVFLFITCRMLRLSVWTYAKGHLGSIFSTIIMFFAVIFLNHVVIDLNIYIRIGVSIVLGATLYTVAQLLLNRRIIMESVAFLKTT